MHQETVIAAIGAQLDALSSLLSTTIALALLAAWAGIHGASKVTVFSLEVERPHAFYILAASFILVNITAIIYFLRLADLLSVVQDANLAQALTALGTHSWAYNPYAYFGPSPMSLIQSGFGYGVMIVIWWIGYATLSLLTDFLPKRRLDRAIMQGFFAVGLTSMGAIQWVYYVVLGRLRTPQFEQFIDVEANVVVRTVFTFAGIGVGALIFAAAQRTRKRGFKN
jgi:hypothetical protein